MGYLYNVFFFPFFFLFVGMLIISAQTKRGNVINHVYVVRESYLYYFDNTNTKIAFR